MRRDQGFFYLDEATAPRMLNWCNAIAIRQIHVGAGLDEQFNDLLMAFPAIAEDDRLEKCGPSEIVDVIDIHARLYESAHGLDVSTFRCRNQRSSPVAICARQIGAMRQRHLENFDMPARARV